MKIAMKRLIRDEKGAAMVLVLVLLILGGLIVAPLLAHMGTGIVAGEVYERRTAELYAADAGVEDAMWNIQHQVDEVERLNQCYPDWSYNISDADGRVAEVNDRRVEVTIEWLDSLTYRVLSVATTDSGSSTTVEAYVEVMVFDLFAGALVSMSDIDFSKNCSVTGDIYYVGEIIGKEYEHDGEEIQVPLSAFPTHEQNEAFAQQFKDEALLGGTHPGDMTIDSDDTLGPVYITGNLYLEDKIKLNLAGTIYVEGSIDFKKDSEVTGSGSIVAVGDIYLSKLPDYGIEGDSIIFSVNGDITFKKEATIEALVYAPNGLINVDKKMTVTGGVIGGNINVKKDGSFTYISKSSSFGFPLTVPYGVEIQTFSISQH